MAGFFVTWNLLIAGVLSVGFYLIANAEGSFSGFALFSLQAFGHFGLYLLGVGSVFGLLVWPFKKNAKISITAWLTITTLVQFILISDLLVFRMYRYHLNGLVWWVLKSPAGRATLGLDVVTISFVVGFFVALAALQYWPFARFFRGNLLPSQVKTWPRIFRMICISIVVAAVFDKTLYAVMDVKNRNAEVSTAARSLPWYWRVTIKKWYARRFGYEALAAAGANGAATVSRNHSSYSPVSLDFDETKPALDILFVVVDSWRFDMLTPEVMPYLSARAAKFNQFTKHYSGGNGTRDGMFSLLSSTHSMRWFDVLNAPEAAPIVTYAKQRNYGMRMRSSTSLEFPEFRRTVFYGMTDDQFYDRQEANTQHDRDIMITEDYLREYAADTLQRPRFDLLFLDSAHGPFSYPDEFAHFEPAADHYFTPSMFSKGSVEPIYNRYRNACRFLDSLINRMLLAIEARGRMQNTIVVITGDHGEEFYDSGYWGHTSAFTEAQLHVPLLLNIPGQIPAVYQHMTRHVDVMPTVLSAAGVRTSATEYSQGFDLFRPEDRFPISCGWDRCAVFDGKTRLIFGAAEYNMTDIELVDRDYKPVASGAVDTAELVQTALRALASPK